MHILFLTDNFPPEVNAPASRTFEHCHEWVKAGHKVTVITCVPNFPKGVVYPGYRNRLRKQLEMREGIHVVRVWSYITANEGFTRRVLDYISYMVSAICASPSVRKVDLVVGTSPQFFTACAAYMVSKLKRIPFIFELRDLWPESIQAVGAMQESRVLEMLEWVELFLYRRAAKVVSVTHSFKQNLINRGIESYKISVVTNGVDLNRYKPQKKDSKLVRDFGLEGKFVAGYVGTHGLAHSLNTILLTAQLMQKKNEGREVQFILLGNGAQTKELEATARRLNLNNVCFIESVPKEEVPRYWSVLDASIIHLRDVDTFKSVIPSKLFESIGMGIPVLHGVRGESAEIVEKGQVGITFQPDNPNSLCEALCHLRDNKTRYEGFRENCLRKAKQYDRKKMAKKMLNVLLDTRKN